MAPACASTVIASGRAVVRSVTRSPDAAASSSATLVSAMTRPRPTTTRWSAVSCSSLIRWLDTSTARPWAASARRKPRIQTMPSGSRPLNGSSSISTGGSPSMRRGDPQPLPHAERVAARLAPGRRLQAGLLDHLVDPPRGQALRVGQPQQVVAGAAARLQRGGVQQRPDVAQRVPQAAGRAARRSARGPRRPRPGRGSPASWWTCPAPLGPTNPVTCRGGTVNDIPSRARVGPNRLRRPVTSIVASMLSNARRAGRPGVVTPAEPSSAPLARGTHGRASPGEGRRDTWPG